MTVKIYGTAKLTDKLMGITKDKEYPIIRISSRQNTFNSFPVTYIDNYGNINKAHSHFFTFTVK